MNNIAWELVTKRPQLRRTKTPAGWLLSCSYKANKVLNEYENLTMSEVLLYISDPEHIWVTIEGQIWEKLSFSTVGSFKAVATKTYRLQIPTGWLVLTIAQNVARAVYGVNFTQALAFVPDQDHIWQVETKEQKE